MAELMSSAGDIALAMQSRSSMPVANSNALKSLIDSSKAAAESANEPFDEAEAREAANKFEALLIHSMLKSMRKTTMSENTSNDRAIYNDMLDERLADTMIEAGGIGIADQIYHQIQQQKGKQITQSGDDATRLRELAKDIPRPTSDDVQKLPVKTVTTHQASTDIGHLRLATGLWSGTQQTTLTKRQQEFVQPLMVHARRNAQKLGTTPNAILAIAALETGWGRSMIKDKHGNNSHNLFGIKATGSDNRYTTTLTTEYVEGSPQKVHARFKTFNDSADAVNGFADFILSNPRYAKALQHAGDPEKFISELQKAGYATDPRYAEKAISIMRHIAGNTLPL